MHENTMHPHCTSRLISAVWTMDNKLRLVNDRKNYVKMNLYLMGNKKPTSPLVFTMLSPVLQRGVVGIDILRVTTLCSKPLKEYYTLGLSLVELWKQSCCMTSADSTQEEQANLKTNPRWTSIESQQVGNEFALFLKTLRKPAAIDASRQVNAERSSFWLIRKIVYRSFP